MTEEIARSELYYHQNEDVIHLLDKDCEVEYIETGVRDAHSYDAFAVNFLKICNDIKGKHPASRILLNISSGTPQMETALCMIAISDPAGYQAIQVPSPERGPSRAPMFNPENDFVEDWYEQDMDNLEDTPSRCQIPELLNFRRPIIQMQILSLIRNYDYSGACQLYENARDNFTDSVGVLLNHARERLNLGYKKAEKLAEKNGLKDVLYPAKRSDINSLIDLFNSMKIKQYRGELNDFALRLEIMTEYLGIYILEYIMRVKLDDITIKQKAKSSYIMKLDKEKCERKIQGIGDYLDEQFPNTGFEWNKPLNSITIVHMVTFLSRSKEDGKYKEMAAEMMKWVELSAGIRNPAAHTIISINEDMFRSYYGKKSADLCRSMQHVLLQVFGTEAKKEAFDIYSIINDMIEKEMEKPSDD